MAPAGDLVKVNPLKSSEVPEADHIMRLAFGTFLGLPNPLDFMGDRNFIAPRLHAKNCIVLAARQAGRLIGTNVVTRWGSFGFFGPLTVLPEYWDRGVAQRLLEKTVNVFDKWGVRQSGLFTFPQSTKHIALYQKFGYWPQCLTSVMTRAPRTGTTTYRLLSGVSKAERDEAFEDCRRITGKIELGLDLTDEIQSVLKHRTGDVVVASGGIAICLHGADTEGGSKTCYIKFAATRSGYRADDRFNNLLEACEAFALERGAEMVEAGVNLSREAAFKVLRARGYRTAMHGVAMQRPNLPGFNRADAYVIDDWR